MQECRDESEIYNYQRIQLSNNKFINGAWGVRLTWFDCNSHFMMYLIFFSGSCVAFEHRILLGFWSHVHQNLANLQDLHKQASESPCKCI